VVFAWAAPQLGALPEEAARIERNNLLGGGFIANMWRGFSRLGVRIASRNNPRNGLYSAVSVDALPRLYRELDSYLRFAYYPGATVATFAALKPARVARSELLTSHLDPRAVCAGTCALCRIKKLRVEGPAPPPGAAPHGAASNGAAPRGTAPRGAAPPMPHGPAPPMPHGAAPPGVAGPRGGAPRAPVTPQGRCATCALEICEHTA
jgi:hypothetical protein